MQDIQLQYTHVICIGQAEPLNYKKKSEMHYI